MDLTLGARKPDEAQNQILAIRADLRRRHGCPESGLHDQAQIGTLRLQSDTEQFSRREHHLLRSPQVKTIGNTGQGGCPLAFAQGLTNDASLRVETFQHHINLPWKPLNLESHRRRPC